MEVVWNEAVVILGVDTGTEGGTALFVLELWEEEPAVTADRKSSNSSADMASLAAEPAAAELFSSSRFISVVLSKSTAGSGNHVHVSDL